MRQVAPNKVRVELDNNDIIEMLNEFFEDFDIVQAFFKNTVNNLINHRLFDITVENGKIIVIFEKEDD